MKKKTIKIVILVILGVILLNESIGIAGWKFENPDQVQLSSDNEEEEEEKEGEEEEGEMVVPKQPQHKQQLRQRGFENEKQFREMVARKKMEKYYLKTREFSGLNHYDFYSEWATQKYRYVWDWSDENPLPHPVLMQEYELEVLWPKHGEEKTKEDLDQMELLHQKDEEEEKEEEEELYQDMRWGDVVPSQGAHLAPLISFSPETEDDLYTVVVKLEQTVQYIVINIREGHDIEANGEVVMSWKPLSPALQLGRVSVLVFLQDQRWDAQKFLRFDRPTSFLNFKLPKFLLAMSPVTMSVFLRTQPIADLELQRIHTKPESQRAYGLDQYRPEDPAVRAEYYRLVHHVPHDMSMERTKMKVFWGEDQSRPREWGEVVNASELYNRVPVVTFQPRDPHSFYSLFVYDADLDGREALQANYLMFSVLNIQNGMGGTINLNYSPTRVDKSLGVHRVVVFVCLQDGYWETYEAANPKLLLEKTSFFGRWGESIRRDWTLPKGFPVPAAWLVLQVAWDQKHQEQLDAEFASSQSALAELSKFFQT